MAKQFTSTQAEIGEADGRTGYRSPREWEKIERAEDPGRQADCFTQLIENGRKVRTIDAAFVAGDGRSGRRPGALPRRARGRDPFLSAPQRARATGVRGHCASHPEGEYLQLQRYETALHRQLERKIKLLVTMEDGSRVAAARKTVKTRNVASSDARALAPRHKLDASQVSGPSAEEEWKEAIKKIRAIYGLTDRDEDAPASPSQARSSEQDGAGSEAKSGQAEASAREQENGNLRHQ